MAKTFITTFMLPLMLQFFTVFGEELETALPPALPPHNHHHHNITLISHNTSIVTERAFKLGFCNIRESYYLCISFTSRSSPNITWMANRSKPIKNLFTSSLLFTETGKLVLLTSQNKIIWKTKTPLRNTPVNRPILQNDGNLVLTTSTGEVFWQSFLEPLDTLLPAMKLTKTSSLVSWVGVNDPSPGIYSLSLKPPVYYEFHLVYKNSISYWSNGNHTISLDSASVLRVEVVGQVSQYTWSNNAWKKLWSMPKWVLGADCGSFAIATENIVKPCDCLTGYEPIDSVAWGFGHYSKGCFRGDACDGTNIKVANSSLISHNLHVKYGGWGISSSMPIPLIFPVFPFPILPIPINDQNQYAYQFPL